MSLLWLPAGPGRAIFTELSISNQQAVLLLTALIIVAVILMLVYRFPILWLPPLITIGKLG